MLMAFLQVTLVVTVVSTVIAAVLGLIIAILLMVLPRPLAWIVRWVANFIRMTPIVVQLIFVFWSTFQWLEPMTMGIIVFGVHYATYMSEVYRAGIESVPKGQWEATTALSMSAARTWRRVVILQALRSTVPPWATMRSRCSRTHRSSSPSRSWKWCGWHRRSAPRLSATPK